MSTLDAVQEVAERHGLRLRRAWPRSTDHLLLDLVRRDGTAVAGQWRSDDLTAARIAAGTGAPAIADRGVVLQADGADRRLPALRGLLLERGSVLVAHRPERRAVVRCADGSYAKVVRQTRLAGVCGAAREAARCGVRVPRVLGVDDEAGVLRTAALPGRTLHDLLGDDDVDAQLLGVAVGRALAALHASPVPLHGARHDAAAELSVLGRWSSLARAHGVGCDPEPPPEAGEPGPLVRVHRDLHDKQLLLEGDGSVGLLDFDLAAAGEAALDVASLLVHLELRVAQGRCPVERAAAVAAALLTGYDPGEAVLRRLPFYAATTRARLRAVYAFRPLGGHTSPATPLLRAPIDPARDAARMTAAGAPR